MDILNFEQFLVCVKNIFEEKITNYDALWRIRARDIDTKFLLIFIIKLIIPKDNRGYSCTLSNLFTKLLSSNVVRESITAPSICVARKKLNASIFKEINLDVIKMVENYQSPPLWFGHRLYTVDGSKFNLPKDLIKEGYKVPFEKAYYPQCLVSCVYEVLTNLPIDFEVSKIINERKCLINHLKIIEKNSVLLMDRGYFSFETLVTCIENSISPIFRLQKLNGYKEIKKFRNSNKTDVTIMLQPPKNLLEDVKNGKIAININPIKVRLIKYKIGENEYVLLTTLLDNKKYPKEIFPDVYHSRWGIEEMLKVSKIITGVQDFHSKSENGIKQEIYAHFLLITILKILELKAYQNIELKEKKDEEKEPPRRLRPLIKKNDEIFKEDEVQVNFEQNLENAQNGKKKVKINTKNSFLAFENVIEQFFFWDMTKFIEEKLDVLLNQIEAVYEYVRKGRHNPRVSHKVPNKWTNKPKGAFEGTVQACF